MLNVAVSSSVCCIYPVVYCTDYPCAQVHKLIDERTLAAEYNTADKLLLHDGVQKYIAYAHKQPTVSREITLNPKLRVYRK